MVGPEVSCPRAFMSATVVEWPIMEAARPTIQNMHPLYLHVTDKRSRAVTGCNSYAFSEDSMREARENRRRQRQRADEMERQKDGKRRNATDPMVAAR
mmetsp:Transcript_40080/g.61612  ORF Transcript_40080/g.61612 Transcript_40080/m.61612 type:complete len:98 (+) Transcript_40080:2-295(+)